MGLETQHIFALSWFFILYTIPTPLLIFSMRRYRSVYYHPFIYYRRPKLVIACCVVTLIYSSIFSPLLILHHAFLGGEFPLSAKATFLLHSLPLLFISLHFSIRFYQVMPRQICTESISISIAISVHVYPQTTLSFQVFYDLNYNSSIADEIWSRAINAKTNNFFIVNRSRYGRPRFLYFVFMGSMAAISVFVITLTLCLSAEYLWIPQIVVLSVWILNVIPLIFIFQKLNSFLDLIKVRPH